MIDRCSMVSFHLLVGLETRVGESTVWSEDIPTVHEAVVLHVHVHIVMYV